MLRLLLMTSMALIALTPRVQAAAPKSPAEIAAASKALAEKREACRLQAKTQKLSFAKRRQFLRTCVKS